MPGNAYHRDAEMWEQLRRELRKLAVEFSEKAEVLILIFVLL